MKIKGLNQRGAFLMIFALVLLVILGFTALGIEAGRWYLVRAELSKSVDAAALAAAKNISNPNVSAESLAQEFGYENFHAGYLGTPGAGVGLVQFSATPIDSDTFRVTGNVNAPATLARLFGIDQIPVVAVAAAQEASKKKTEIMMVLDRTGSMGNPGYKMKDLKNAATSFVDNFRGTQDNDKMGLISYSVDVTVDSALGTKFVNNVISAINGMNPMGATNMADALAQVAFSFDDQSAVPPDKRVQQNLIFFSDGMPTAFRAIFMSDNKNYDAVAMIEGDYVNHPHAINCRPDPGEEIFMQIAYNRAGVPCCREGSNESNLTIYTGDGIDWPNSKSTCIKRNTTKWEDIFIGFGPVPGYKVDACNIPQADLAPYLCSVARKMALDNAQKLKDKGIKIYVVGLGTDMDIDADLLRQISSGEKYTYIARDSGDLAGIFNKIAKEIKLRLVQ